MANGFIPVKKIKNRQGQVVENRVNYYPVEEDFIFLMQHLLQVGYALAPALTRPVPQGLPDKAERELEAQLAQFGAQGLGLALQRLIAYRKKNWFK